ncbi:hypothetical protein CTheo_5470 [Ceratobasidium theobromae]|uniref:Transcription factor domain-containing protein n=1 Tax=Ceratobasidium theobromae TaxID=1582974 RepID=A0A5N5QIH0_9AGAM|nr:hypothetical protein CTheo_5470 [Ceratobasidium theobromae]
MIILVAAPSLFTSAEEHPARGVGKQNAHRAGLVLRIFVPDGPQKPSDESTPLARCLKLKLARRAAAVIVNMRCKPCSWEPDGADNRPATKQYVESLRTKIQVLQSEVDRIKQSNTEPAASSYLAPGMRTPPLDPQPGSPSYMGASFDLIPDVTSQKLYSNSAQPSTPLLNVPDRSPHSTSSHPLPLSQTVIYQYIFNIDTSALNRPQTLETHASLTCQWNRYLPDLDFGSHIGQISRLEHDTILYRYFNCGPNWVSGLLPDLFLRDLVDHLQPATICPPDKHHYYTPILHCSLLATAVALSDDPHIRAHDTRRSFASRAKEWLDEEFNHLNPALIQSLILLSEYHYGVGEMDQGYMYMGAGIRGFVRLTEGHQLIIVQWELTPPRRRPSSEIGVIGPYSFKAFDSSNTIDDGIPPPRVPINLSTPSKSWGNSLSTSSTLANEIIFSCFVECCKLIAIAAPMIDRTLVSTFVATTHPELIVHLCRIYDTPAINTILAQLDSWLKHLPGGLLIGQHSTTVPAQVLNLHICYWWLTLQLHFPPLKRIQSMETAGRPVVDSDAPHNDASRGKVIEQCDLSTGTLLQLFAMYDELHGFKYFPRNMLKAIYICGCALKLKCDLASDELEEAMIAQLQEEVAYCVSALRMTGETWPCALLLAEELAQMPRNTPWVFLSYWSRP